MATVLICFLIAALIFGGIQSYRKKIGSGCCGSESDAAPSKIKVQDRNLSHYPYEKVLKIDGMTCRNCVIHVQNALNLLDGVFAKVNLEQRSAEVYMKEEIPDQLLRNVVSGAGYTVMSISKNCSGPKYEQSETNCAIVPEECRKFNRGSSYGKLPFASGQNRFRYSFPQRKHIRKLSIVSKGKLS